MAPSAETNHTTAAVAREDKDVLIDAFQLAASSVLPMTMQAAFELGIFDIIAETSPEAQLSASEIAAKLPTENPEAPIMLDRMLRLLASHSVLTCSVVGQEHIRLYGLAPVCKYFVRNKDGVSLGPLMCLNQDKVVLDGWTQVKGAVIGGIPFNRLHGLHAFEYAAKDPRYSQVFNSAMFNHTTILGKHLLESYKGFENLKHKHVIDVGGNFGITISLVVAKYPFIKGVNLDLPHVIQHAPNYPGVEHIGGDMFENVPKGDTIFMKSVLHDWSDEQCLKILKNCYNAIPDDGKVIVMDIVLPTVPETSATTRVNFEIDLLMMIQHSGGKERTRDEFMALAIGAGFSGIEFVCGVCNFWVMEFFK